MYRLKPEVLELHNPNVVGGPFMVVVAGLAALVVLCLLLSMLETPPAVGR
ncbi:MAG TPA: hypothetical protein VMA31_09630 [Bryobacteraceae bacterium]|nr:hypothetical protein [Bryobacteraceae bacterium]